MSNIGNKVELCRRELEREEKAAEKSEALQKTLRKLLEKDFSL